MTPPTNRRPTNSLRLRGPHVPAVAAWLVAIVLLFAGCGDAAESPEGGSTRQDPPPSTVAASPSAQPGRTGGEGTYTVDVSPPGAVIDAELYAPEDDRFVRRLERFRTKIDNLEDAQVAYLLANIDNTEGSSRVAVSSFQVVTEEGAVATFRQVNVLLAQWRQQVDAYDTNTFQQGGELIEFFRRRGRVAPGETSSQIFATVDKPADIAEVFVLGNFDTQQMFLR